MAHNNKKYYKNHNSHKNGNKFYYKNNKKQNNYNKKQKYYYHKNKKQDKKEDIIIKEELNNRQEEVKENILIQQPEVEVEDIFEKENIENAIKVSLENETPDYEEFEFVPIKKKDTKTFKKKSMLKYVIGAFAVIALVFGVSYSFFTYTKEDSRQADVYSGDVYVKIEEQAVNLSLNRMYPRTAEEARTRSDNYIDFTLKGKNTSETKEIGYSLNIANGEDVSGKTRINPQYLIIDLQEKINNEYVYIKNAVPLSTFSFSDIVPTNTTSEITREFRLRIWVSDAIIISDTETNATYTQTQFNNLYANVHVELGAADQTHVPTGTEKLLAAIEAKQNATTNSCNPVWIDDNGTANDTSDDITYFSGTNDCVDMNYVWYSGKLWRITAIYPDGSMKLVTQNNITSIAFNATGQVNFYTDANTKSYMYQWLNEDFYDTLYNANQFIDTSKRWNATMPTNTTISTKPLETNMVAANVGLLNNYEYYNSYRCINSSTCTGSNYVTGYLNIGYYWWLLNPYSASLVWRVDRNGVGDNSAPTGASGGRPSIYLKSGLEFTGDGTNSSPYKIVGDKDAGQTNELINTRISGEYIKLSDGTTNQVFRIIGVEDNKTKIITMDYAENKNTRKFATSTGSANTLWGSGTTTDTDTWYTYLNDNSTGYLKNLKDTYGELFDSGLYYLGTSGYNYKLSVCANTTSGNTKVCDKTNDKGTFNIGLPRYGEMFATQQGTGYSNSITMWLMNRYSASNVWFVGNSGSGNYNAPTNARGGRPTVHLKSTVKILSGSGTETDPYVVGLSS